MNHIRKTSLILALAITFLFTSVILYFSNLKLKVQQAGAKEGQLVTVVVAASDIKVNSVIKEEWLKEVSIPQKYAVAGTIGNVKDVVGKVSKDDIYSGEQILLKNLYEGENFNRISAMLPLGYRALTIKVDSVNGVAGNIKKGDFIDISALIKEPYMKNETVRTVFQNVNVIEAKDADGSYLLTIYMKPEDINKLFLFEETGKIRVSLRQISDREASPAFNTDTTILR